MDNETAFASLLAAHKRLDNECRNKQGRIFVADWYCDNPFLDESLRTTPVGRRELQDYYFQNDETVVHEEIAAFHKTKDGVNYDNSTVFVTAGMTPILTAQMMMLRSQGIQRIYCVRPLYYTYYYLARTLGIELIPVNEDPLNTDRGPLRLPTGREEWLLVCDPIWFMGRPILTPYIDQIRDWQNNTGGMVIVDGAFQYMNWRAPDAPEATARLDPARTLRAVCPTKAVATHGIRFSYCLLPPDLREPFRYAYANTAGSGTAADAMAGLRIMQSLNSPDSNKPLLAHIASRYQHLTTTGAISDDLDASCTYFCFVDTSAPPQDLIAMDQVFFDTRCYPGKTRFNLLLDPSELAAFERSARRSAPPQSDEPD